ncbi:PAS domain S-box protein, partial [Thioclava sp. BHET1]
NANHQAAQFFGYRARTELIGISIARHLAAGGAVAQGRIFDKLLQGENPVEIETQFVNIAGKTLDALLRISLPPDSNGWDRVLITALDVTERNKVQQRLAESHAELTHMARVMTLGQIAASIAHEVNQPLSAVINYAKSGRRWLQREAPDALEVRDCLEQIAQNGERAAGVIAGIRDLTRKSDPVRNEVDINQIFAETTALLVRDLRSAGVSLRGDLARDLPGILADRVQIQQILMNLILNASHAMADTPDEDRIVLIAAHPVGDRLEITVSDRGTGLNGKDPEALFKPFFTTKTQGMGMGLTICRSIIEQHGGTLVAEQNPGGGVVMRFDLPLLQAAERTHS